jgi:heterotetrameric sarcosine oxidase gamma subunit
MAEPTLFKPTSAWTGLVAAAPAGARVTARPLEGLGLASVHARKGDIAALTTKVKELFGLDLPDSPRRVAAGAVAFVATGPGAWMAVCEGATSGWADQLAGQLEGLAAVCDQSDGYAAIRLEGPAVLDVLAKGVFIDLDVRVFPVGSAAGVTVAHVGVVLWRREDLAFEMLSFRSYAGSFWHWIEESAGEYGLAVETQLT